MGLVKIDVHKQEKQYERITFSDVECIKALIKYRSVIDPYYGIKENFDITTAGDVKPLNQELIVTYVALDDLISKCKLNVKQRFIIEKIMGGLSEQDISEMFKQDLSTTYQTLDKICLKIKELNDVVWKYDYIYLNHKEAEWNYKKCKKCEEYKPATKDFFHGEPKGKDGFKSICKSCK